MGKKTIIYGLTFFVLITSFIIVSPKKNVPGVAFNDGFCGIKNTSFKSGEQLTYHVYYSVIGTFINAGTGILTCVNEKWNGKNVYHIEGVGNSNKKYDFIFKVRDKYESWVDTATFLPVKFNRKVSEGKYKKLETVTFNHAAKTATSLNKTFTIPKCVQDILSAIYYSRNIDFNSLTIGQKVNFSITLDDEIFNMYVKYLGKEKIKTKYGRFNAVKFKPLLIKGTIFEGGEKMTVWVSDDGNHIPLRVESPISVGSVKVDMMSYRNLRYPLSSFISF